MTRRIRALTFVLSSLGLASGAFCQTELPAWGTVPIPNAGAGPGNVLNAVAVLSESDAWAAGSWNFSPFIEAQVQHWNGSTWTHVAIPPEVTGGELFGIAAVASNDVWIVGGSETGGGALILHWNGAALSVSSHPDPGTFNRLYAVAAISANDVWAVGEYASGGVSKTLTLHWNGAAWSQVSSPTRARESTKLNGVAAVASNDVWAVGEAGTKTYTIHWNGTSWTNVSSPSSGFSSRFTAVSAAASNEVWAVGENGSGLFSARWNGLSWTGFTVPKPAGSTTEDLKGVVALGPGDVWAVGFYSDGPKWNTLVEHWNGSSWQIVSSPSPDPSINFLSAIAEGPTRLWAVGRSGGTLGSGGGGGTLVERRDGTTWTIVPSANGGAATNQLLGLSIVGASDVWAVGDAGGQSLTEHWDGSAWSIVTSPNLAFGAELKDVDGIASNDVWAVGNVGDGASLDWDTVIFHWNGSAWAIVPSPNENETGYNDLDAVAAVSSDNAWAVGYYQEDDYSYHTMIQHWDGSAWSVVEPGCGNGTLSGITVVSAADIWAVGSALTCHYDGSTWTRVSSPQPRGAYNEIAYYLFDVDAISSNDVWAVGQRVVQQGEYYDYLPFAQHWNGRKWKPFYGAGGGTGIVALASNDVWAVGFGIAHWNGSVWETVARPIVGLADELTDIDATSASNLWAAGYFYDEDSALTRTLAERAPSLDQGGVTGGTGYSGALVTWTGQVSGTVETDTAGVYEVAGLPAGTYTFLASAPFCDPAVATVTVVAGATVTQELRVSCP
jgi:hypothetical protein